MSSKQASGAARKDKKRHGPVYFLAAAAIMVVAVFVVYTIISDNIKIREDTAKYNELVEMTNSLNERNEQITGYLENSENLKEYIEEIAREKLDYANPDERIYYVVPSAGE